MGIAVAFFMFALFIVVIIIILDLVGVEGAGTMDVENSHGTQEMKRRRFSSCRHIAMKAIPLTAIKIVVVVWQIITQVCKALDKYCRVYDVVVQAKKHTSNSILNST